MQPDLIQWSANMQIADFLAKLEQTPEAVSFQDTMAVIEANYNFTPTAFRNGELHNEAGQNSGSCKLLSFASLQQLSTAKTLHCFGDYYRKDVLEHPTANDHQNIRNFIRFGWEGVVFNGTALSPL
jgi:hypothetical protein